MKPFISILVFCCSILATANVFAQNVMVDSAVAKYVGKKLTECLGISRFDPPTGAGNQKFCQAMRCFYYTPAQDVFGVSEKSDPTDTTEAGKAKYLKYFDQYDKVIKSLGDKDRKVKKEDGNKTITWKGTHSIITAVYNGQEQLMLITFIDTYMQHP